MDTLYYDGRCPLCAREARLLARISDKDLALTDIHTAAEMAGEPPRALRLTTLHLRTDRGEWLTGVDAVVQAWSHTAYGWIFRLLRWPLLCAIADWCYAGWALHRYRRLYGCPDCENS